MFTLTRNIIWFYNYDLYFSGISGCAYALVAPMFISEMSEPSIRGGLASVMQLMASVGVLFVGILNINGTVHWNFISAILIGVPGNSQFIYSQVMLILKQEREEMEPPF